MSEQNEISSRLGRIEGQLEIILDESKVRNGRYDQHDKRISAVERGQTRIIAWASGAGAVAATVASYLFKGHGT